MLFYTDNEDLIQLIFPKYFSLSTCMFLFYFVT